MPRIRTSVWFFLVLVLLGAGAVVAPILYNLSQLLTPEQLAEAKARWESRGPADYDLSYLERVDDDRRDNYEVKVRHGEVVELKVNEEVFPLGKLSPGRRQAFTVPGMFAQIEKYLAEEEGGKRRNYATARFDPELGYPLRYVRRVRGSRARLEWSVKLVPVSEPGA